MRVSRVLALAGYYGIAQFLPLSHRPFGRVFKAIRCFFVRRLLASAGTGINVESRVDFGSGRRLRLGDRSGIGPRSIVSAADIGPGVIIGPELMVVARKHIFEDPTTWIGAQGVGDVEPITIGEGSWIGTRVTILPGITIGKYAVIGASAVVTQDIPDYAVAAGNPARVIRYWDGREGATLKQELPA